MKEKHIENKDNLVKQALVFLKTPKKSQQNTCTRVFQIFKNTFCYRTPPVAALEGI